MRLRTRNGQLTNGSIYKLVVIGWTLSWCLLFVVIFGLLLVVAALGGPVMVNGEPVTEPLPFLLAALPGMVLLPLLALIQSLIFGGFFVLVMMVYRMVRPITVETDVPAVFT